MRELTSIERRKIQQDPPPIDVKKAVSILYTVSLAMVAYNSGKIGQKPFLGEIDMANINKAWPGLAPEVKEYARAVFPELNAYLLQCVLENPEKSYLYI